MILLKNLAIIFVLLFTNYSSLLSDTFDFMKAKRPLAGKAGNIKPPSFLAKIYLIKEIPKTLTQIMKISSRQFDRVLLFW